MRTFTITINKVLSPSNLFLPFLCAKNKNFDHKLIIPYDTFYISLNKLIIYIN